MAWVYRKKFKEKYPDGNIKLFKKTLSKKINYYCFPKKQEIFVDNILEVAEQILIETINKDQIFYIGVTSCPLRRLFQHTLDKLGLPSMNVVKYSIAKEDIKFVEKHLIKIYGSHPNNYNNLINNKSQKGGGEGLSNRKSFIYILSFDKEQIFNEIIN